ncbi:MAG: hypothetical protein HZA88_07285 [Verrucomicrobia bacterium]|nr:hypothetical protein [Verrucomicrobiota bacterium]
MNLITHLFKKDVRRLRVLLGLWSLLVVLQAVLIGTAPGASAGDIGLQAIFYLATLLFPLLQLGALVVIIPLLVQDEPLVGTTAFWFTRPIARKDLLASKGVFMLVLLVLPPLLAELIMLICNEVTPRHVALAVPEALLSQISVVLGIWTLASVTRTFARFAIVGIIVVVVSGIAGFAISIATLFGAGFFKDFPSISLSLSRGVVSSIVGIVLCFVAIGYQYLTRKTAHTIVLACLTVVAALTASSAWPVDFLKKAKAPVQKELFNSETVHIASDNTGKNCTSDAFSFGPAKTPKKRVQGNLVVSGLPPGLVGRVTFISAQLAYPDGKKLESNTGGDSLSPEARIVGQWDGGAVSHVLGGIKVLNGEKQSSQFETLFEAEADSFSQYGGKKGIYTAEVHLDVRCYKVTGVLPLRKRARLDIGSEHVAVADVLREPQGCQVLLSVKNVTLLFATDTQMDIGKLLLGRGKVLYVLRNQKRGQAFIPTEDHDVAAVFFNAYTGARLKITPLRVRYVSEFSDAPLDEAWLADADLVRIEPVEVETITKSLRIEEFVMESKKDKPEREKRASAKSPAASQ